MCCPRVKRRRTPMASSHARTRLSLPSADGAYLRPGQFGREPWKNADIAAFGYMSSLAEGRSPWTAPALAGLPGDGALLPYWLGALSIKALPFVDPANAARVPFALLLAATLA